MVSRHIVIKAVGNDQGVLATVGREMSVVDPVEIESVRKKGKEREKRIELRVAAICLVRLQLAAVTWPLPHSLFLSLSLK